MRLKFSLLGPVRAWLDDTELDLGPPKQRAFLAVLLINAGDPLSLREIVAVLWGEDPPDSADNLVHRYVGVLRRLFEPGLRARGASRYLVRGSGGYRLVADPADFDLLRFRELRQEATRLAGRGDPGAAAETLLAALDLWRGEIAADIPAEVRTQPAFTSVDGERRSALQSAAEYAPAGRPEVTNGVLLALREAATRHPLDEMLQARLMLLLAATGRQAEALGVHEATRRILAEEMGLDPGPELRSAHQRVLQQAATEPEPAEQFVPRPAQLPADLAVFAGRQRELDQFPRLAEEPGPAAVVTIGGMAGAGKTTLAIHWAHLVADRFPDGQLYIDLHGFHPNLGMISPADALHSFLAVLGVPNDRIPASLDAQTAQFRSLLAGRRVLIVLDNARDSEQVRPLLPGSPGCLTVVTSRNQLYDLVSAHGATAITLEHMPDADAAELLCRRLGTDRVAREPEAATQIVELAGRIPLTLAMVCARAVMNPHFSLATIARELHDAHGSLDAFVGESPRSGIRSVLDWSYHVLEPPAARLFRLLAVHPGPDCSLTAAASLAGTTTAAVRRPVGELLRANLMTETEPGRFRSHDLLRAYARELDTDEDTAPARRRLLDHYLHTAVAAGELLFAGREVVPLDAPADGVIITAFRNATEAATWLDSERPVLIAAIRQNVTAGDRYCWQIAGALAMYLDRAGSWLLQREIQVLARTSAEAIGDRVGMAGAARALGFAEGRLRHWDEAERHLNHALRLFAELGDGNGEARTHRLMAFLLNQREQYGLALEHYRAAADLYRATGWQSGLGNVHNETGWTYILIGDYPKALEQCRRAVEVHQAIGDRNGEAAAWDSIGCAQHRLGAYPEALLSFERALRIYRSVHDRYLEADTLVHMGDTHRDAGHPPQAAESWKRALEILDELGHPDADRIRNLTQRWQVRIAA